jgi:hypothetical protein
MNIYKVSAGTRPLYSFYYDNTMINSIIVKQRSIIQLPAHKTKGVTRMFMCDMKNGNFLNAKILSTLSAIYISAMVYIEL